MCPKIFSGLGQSVAVLDHPAGTHHIKKTPFTLSFFVLFFIGYKKIYIKIFIKMENKY